MTKKIEKNIITNHDDIRKLMLESRLKTETVTLEFGGSEVSVIVKQLSADSYLECSFKSTDSNGNISYKEFYLNAILNCVYFTDSNERVFNVSDLDYIKNQEATILNPLVEAIVRLNNTPKNA